MENNLYIDVVSNKYPLTIEDIRQRLPRISLKDQPDERQLVKHGFYRVERTEKPDKSLVVEGKPRLVEGVYYQTWDIKEPSTVKELKDESLDLVRKHFKDKMKKGYKFRDGLHIPIDDSRMKITEVLLEAFLLKEEEKNMSFTLVSVEDEVFDLDVTEATNVLRKALTYRRYLNSDFRNDLKRIHSCQDIEKLKSLKNEFHIVKKEYRL